MLIGKYYIRDKNEVVSSAELFELRHFVRDEELLRGIGIFPIYEDKPPYNWLEQKLVANTDLVFDENRQGYVETYTVVSLSETKKAAMMEIKQHQDAIIRKEEILKELDSLDAKSARSMRAILSAQASGTEPSEEDKTVLQGLEDKAIALRIELKAIEDNLSTKRD